MYTGQMVFSQLMDFLPKHEFDKCVRRYQGNYRVRKFTSLDQFLCMAFAQLAYRGELARHRNLSASRRVKTLSCRHPRPRLPKHPGRCQRDERLAHLRRLRPRAHCQSQKTVRRRGLWSRLATDGLRAGFDNYRSVSFALPVGPI